MTGGRERRRLVRATIVLGLLAANLTAQSEPFTGFVDVRNRLVQDVGGDFDVYRSVVNLGEGPRLFDAELHRIAPGGRWLDELHFSANNWGGDPYNTASLEARRDKIYELRLRYRNVAYFNNLPTFANPLLQEGLLTSQRALDVTRRQIDLDLELRPGKRVTPYFGFYRADGFGRGVTTYVSESDQYPVSTDLDDRLVSARGGVRIQALDKLSLTFEGGRTDFADRQEVFYDGAEPQPGNRGSDNLFLDQFRQRYRADGAGTFTRAVLQAAPHERVRFSGQVLFSQPTIDVTQRLDAAGSFFSQTAFAPFTGAFEQNLADANRPRTSASWTSEVRPWRRLRVVQSWMTDRLHVSSGSTLAQLLNTTPETDLSDVAFRTLALDYSQHQTDLIFDVGRSTTLRGGHRYVWGAAETPPASLQFGPDPRNRGRIRRHVALAGAAVRLFQGKLRTSADFEASPGEETFFRTGLMRYQKGKARARYRVRDDLAFQASFSVLHNRNPAEDIRLESSSTQSSGSLFWSPGGGERWTVLADYSYSTVKSDIDRVNLPFFGTELASYRDRAHYAGAFVETLLPRRVHLRLGGSFSVNRGSRPTEFYQPEAQIRAPLHEGVDFTAGWRWYGFAEEFLRVEDFRTHTVSAGVRWGW